MNLLSGAIKKIALLWSLRRPFAASVIVFSLELCQKANLPKKLAYILRSASLKKNCLSCSCSASLRPTGTLNLRRISYIFSLSVDSSRRTKSSGPNNSSRYFRSLSGVSYFGFTETKTGTGLIYYFPSLVFFRILMAFIRVRRVKGHTSGQRVLPK